MSKYHVEINTEIGVYGVSKSFVRHQLNAVPSGKSVFVRVNSLGGSVDHALSIASLFQDRGDVVCDFYALNASAATLLSLTAKKVRIHEDALYLIHKPLVFVLAWEMMNVDAMDEYMKKLDATKKSLEVITLTMAKMYMRKSGKSLRDVLNLMKEERWLTATEAVEWGFCDEIIRGKAELSASASYGPLGLPALPDGYTLGISSSSSLLSSFCRLFNISKHPNMNNVSIVSYAALVTLLKSEQLTPGSKDGSVELSLTQLDVINKELSRLSTALSASDDEVKKLKRANEELQSKLDDALDSPGADSGGVPKPSDDQPDAAEDESLFAAAHAARELYNKI